MSRTVFGWGTFKLGGTQRLKRSFRVLPGAFGAARRGAESPGGDQTSNFSPSSGITVLQFNSLDIVIFVALVCLFFADVDIADFPINSCRNPLMRSKVCLLQRSFLALFRTTRVLIFVLCCSCPSIRPSSVFIVLDGLLDRAQGLGEEGNTRPATTPEDREAAVAAKARWVRSRLT